MGYLALRADEIQPGDTWLCNSDERVLVTGVELATDEAFAHHGMGIDIVRISGRIVKGWGRGTESTWTKLASEGIEVTR